MTNGLTINFCVVLTFSILIKKIMKNLISLLTLVALSTAFFAQTPTKESKVRIIMDKDENGVVTKMDTTFELTNSADIQDVLQQYGIEADIDIDEKEGSTQVMRFEMHIDGEEDSNVDANSWIDKDGQVQVAVDATKRFQVLDGSVMELLENMEDVDEETREEVRQALENIKLIEEKEGAHKGVKVIRFEANEDMDAAADGKHRMMMFRSKDGDVQLDDIDVDDVVQIDVRKMKSSDQDGVNMIREIRVVIELEDVNEADKATLKRAGAPVATSIAESLQLDDLVFYPNPNDGRFRLRFNAPNEGDVNVRVMNVQGKTLYTKDLPSFSGSYDEVISIEDQAAGAYLLSISQNGQTVNKKLVKQ